MWTELGCSTTPPRKYGYNPGKTNPTIWRQQVTSSSTSTSIYNIVQLWTLQVMKVRKPAAHSGDSEKLRLEEVLSFVCHNTV